MATKTIMTPDLGGADSVEIIEIFVAVGDVVDNDTLIMALESDKAAMEIPAEAVGKITKILVKEGDNISQGTALLEIEASSDGASEAPAETVVESAPAVEEPEQVAEEPIQQESIASQESVITVPDIGSDDAVEVIEISVAVGDDVSEGDTLLTLESDKASMEIPATSDAKIVELLVKEGQKVKTGDAIAKVLSASVAAAPAPAPAAEPEPQAAKAPVASAPIAAPVAAPASTVSSSAPANLAAEVYAGPATRTLARELGVDLTKVKGTGPRGRIQKEDLHAYVKQSVKVAETGVAVSSGAGIPKVPAVDFAKFGDIELIKMSKIARVTADNMQRSWLNVPHVTQWDDADITELEAFRNSIKAEAEKRGVKVTPVAFLLKAVAAAIEANPAFNRSLHEDGEHLVQKKYIHIGMAVDTPRGLVVPVLRDVNKKGIYQIAEEVGEMAAKARDGKLSVAEMQGGCFTISSLGGLGGNGFTPIVNTPEVGILGVSKSQMKPVWNGAEFVPRLMLPLSLSYDHRVINGADCGRFFTYLVQLLGDIRRLTL